MTFPHNVDFKAWRGQVAALLKANRVQAGAYRFTQVSPTRPHVQSAAASALYALIWGWIDAEMAADELKSIIAQQAADGERAGIIPQWVDWNSKPPQTDFITSSSLPLLAAYATMRIYHISGDYNLLEKMYSRLSLYYRRQSGDDGGVLSAAYRVAEWEALAHLAQDMGKTADHDRWQQAADQLRSAMQTDGRAASFEAVGTLLFAGCPSTGQALELVRQLANPPYWTPFPANIDSQGVTVLNNWQLYIGLRRYHFDALASHLAQKTLTLIETQGFCASYNGNTGEGSGQPPDLSGGLVLDMLARETMGKPRAGQCI